MILLSLLLLVRFGFVEAAAPRPHIVMFLQDDQEHWMGFLGNEEAASSYEANTTALARSGLILRGMYSHWHCSPTRRSFLSGRLPIHHGEQLSGVATDDLDLRQTWVSEKLASRGYVGHWIGKGHTGYASTHHLPVEKGFASHFGFLGGSQSYTSNDRWQDSHPVHNDSQFSDPPCPSASCSAASFLANTILPCGSPIRFANVSNASQCCAECQGEAGCSHWVFNPTDVEEPPCHLKSGETACVEKATGATSGIAGGCAVEYSSELFGQLAIQAIRNHDPATPLFLYLPFQAVHVPYDPVPHGPYNSTYNNMHWSSDVFLGAIVQELQVKGMWDHTLFAYCSDNGGVVDGINWPLRGEKHGNFQGGMNVAAFLAGGFLPQHLRGKESNLTMHVVDFYATFASLAGASPHDPPPTPPLPVDPANPRKDIYGNNSFPNVDGVDVWDLLLQETTNRSAAHPSLVLSREVILKGNYKLIVAQPLFKTQNTGWRQKNGDWTPAPNALWPCNYQDTNPNATHDPRPYNPHGVCLFDLENDETEHVNLADTLPDVVTDLYQELNNTVLTFRDCSGWMGPIPGPNGQCSPPELLGPCNADCAAKYWANGWGEGFEAPICAVGDCT